MVQKISVCCAHLGLAITAISTFGIVETNGILRMQSLILNPKVIGWGMFS